MSLEIEPSVGYVGLYLGLEGDIAANGATSANEWIYESWDVDGCGATADRTRCADAVRLVSLA